MPITSFYSNKIISQFPVMKKCCLLFLLLLNAFYVIAQQNVHPTSQEYQWPSEPEVKAKLDKWQDQKFGMLIHWGLYSQAGIMESWNLCSEDWIDRDSTIAYEDYKKWYWGLKKDFNPVNFDPSTWAIAAKSAGMKYVIFTTKHHDGFNMFDTKQTDFKISDGPFKNNAKADVAKYVFDAFRKQGFMIGAYFSKPDWHSENYWWPKYATADRNNNYDIRKYPWRWNKFKTFTYNQISELMNNYGAIDILWLDGGWVRPLETVNDEVRAWGARITEWSQDIDMPRIADMARKAQPGLLIVDRTVNGPYENYQTPEQSIPKTQLNYPWESCLTLANNWGYVPNDPYKSSAKVIHALIEVVAKGGSLVLGIGPKPDGTLTGEALQRMKEIGAWLDKNGEAIYNTRITKHYHDGNIWFTQSKDKKMKYALVCIAENENIPTEISWHNNPPSPGTKITLLQTGKTVQWKQDAGVTTIFLTGAGLVDNKIPALAFSFTSAD